jgi:hypothetical protein
MQLNLVCARLLLLCPLARDQTLVFALQKKHLTVRLGGGASPAQVTERCVGPVCSVAASPSLVCP